MELNHNIIIFILQVKAGTILNFLCVFVIAFANETWLMTYFEMDTIPWDIHNGFNDTLPSSTALMVSVPDITDVISL